MHSANTCRWSGKSLAPSLLRWALGIQFLSAGIFKLTILGSFVHQMLLPMFAKTFLPPELLTVYGYALPFVETAVGACLVLGICQTTALCISGIMFLILAFGQGLLQHHDVVSQIYLYILMTAAALSLRDFDRLSITGCRRTHHPTVEPGGPP